ncbi:DUF3488 and transglutaminase-like domain-containing protein [Embleya sp. NPDC001921]
MTAARPTRGRRALLPVVALAGCVGLAFHRVFGTREVLGVTLMCAIVPTILALVCSGGSRSRDTPVNAAEYSRGSRTGTPLWPSLICSLLAWTFTMSATLYRDRAVAHILPTPALVRSMSGDVIDAPRSILTTVLPAPAHPDMLVLVAACVWITAFAGAEIVLRTRMSAAPAAPALLALVVPVLLGVGGQGSNTAVVSALTASIGLLLLVRSPTAGTSVRITAVGIPVVVVIVVLVGLLGPHLQSASARRPPDLRAKVDPPPGTPLQGINPLDRVSAWLQEPDVALFTVNGESGLLPTTTEGCWRLAVLDDYDGVSWLPAAGLRPTAGRVPGEGGARPESSGSSVYRVTVQELDGVWLPGADRPVQVTAPGVELLVEPSSGALATGSGLRPGLRFEVDSRIPRYDPDRLQYLQAAADRSATALPLGDPGGAEDSPTDFFRERATIATQGSTFPYQQALRLADWLRDNHTYDRGAVPGHSYRNLRFFLETTKAGTSEQFAAAFAVMARALNLPSRVVVGFTRGSDRGDGSLQVRSGDVMAWPEVEFAGVGWVPFSPMPRPLTDSSPLPRSPQEAAPEPVQGKAVEGDASRREKDARIAAQPRAPANYSSARPTGNDSWAPPLWSIPLVLAGALLIVHVALAAAAPRIRRRRRRGRRDPYDRVIGAWEQIEDRLVSAGMPTDTTLTVSEVAGYGVLRLSGPTVHQLPELGDLVNELVYGGRSAAAADADAAWRQCVAVEAAVRDTDGLPSLLTRAWRRLRPTQVWSALRATGGRRR